MHIGVTSQNLKTITKHAAKTRRFLVYRRHEDGDLCLLDPIELAKEQNLHTAPQQTAEHPVFKLDVLITGSCGPGFRDYLASHKVRVIATSETDPEKAVSAFLAGETLSPSQKPPSHSNPCQLTHPVG